MNTDTVLNTNILEGKLTIQPVSDLAMLSSICSVRNQKQYTLHFVRHSAMRSMRRRRREIKQLVECKRVDPSVFSGAVKNIFPPLKPATYCEQYGVEANNVSNFALRQNPKENNLQGSNNTPLPGTFCPIQVFFNASPRKKESRVAIPFHHGNKC